MSDRIYGSYQDDDILVISMEDMLKPNTITISPDYCNALDTITISSDCWNTLDTTITATAPYEQSVNMTAFKCENCGGNSYSYKDGKVVCDYCGTMFTTRG